MKVKISFIFLLLLCVFCSPKPELLDELPVVKTSSGFVQGAIHDGVQIFKGVPFAEPPVGDLRWKAPVSKRSWTDTLRCTRFGASPIQNPPVPFAMWSQEFITPAEPLSEDCLYLNIWAPANSSGRRLPVLVWIHGGAFTSGSGACAVYDGEALAKKDIVYISINYRLGVLGFMAHPELTAESPDKSSGNYGLMDQIAALNWIQENVERFGGDPGKVTIAGQSAGSMSVQALVASPLAKGLFRGAIGESGAMTNRPTAGLKEAERVGITLANGKSLSELRQMSADSLLARGNKIPFGSFFPITDGYVLPLGVGEIFEKHLQNDVPTLAGWVEGDGALAVREPLKAADFRKNALAMFGKQMGEFDRLFPATTDTEAAASQDKLGRMRFAGYPDHRWLILNSSPGYLYEFTFVPTDKPGFPNYGAFHTSEVPFALHTLSKWDRPWQQRDYDVEKYMSGYWLNFVRNGDPNGNGLPEWKRYNTANGFVMEFGTQPKLHEGRYRDEFRLLGSAQPDLPR